MNKMSAIILLCFMSLFMVASAGDIRVYTIWQQDKFYHPGACIYLDGTDPSHCVGFTTCLGKTENDPSLILMNISSGRHELYAEQRVLAFTFRGKETIEVLPNQSLNIHIPMSYLKLGSMPTWPLNDTRA